MDRYDRSIGKNRDFIRELIEAYKNERLLWDTSHEQYRRLNLRLEAYKRIAEQMKKHYADIDDDYVRMKIEVLRSSYRKARQKMRLCQEDPPLWYYKMLCFVDGIEVEEDEKDVGNEQMMQEENDDSQDAKYNLVWTDELITTLIEAYKEHKYLYDPKNGQYTSTKHRSVAYMKIAAKMAEVTGKSAKSLKHLSKVRMRTLKTNFYAEWKRENEAKKDGEEHVPNFRYYKQLSFLTPWAKMTAIKENNGHGGGALEEEEDPIKTELLYDSTDFQLIAENIQYKLNKMQSGQRDLAEKLIREVLYHGQMENLTENSCLKIDE